MPDTHLRKYFVILTFAALSACGGGGGSTDGGDGTSDGGGSTGGGGGGDPVDSGGPDVTPNPSLIYADDQPVQRATYYGKTFPISLITHDPTTGALGKVQGSVEYVDEDRVRVTYDGTTTEYDLRDPDGQRINYTSGMFGDGSDLILATVTSANISRPSDVFGEATIMHTMGDQGGFQFSGVDYGVFGLVTPENRLTGSARYTQDYNSEVLITTTSWIDENDDDTTFTRVDEVKSVSVDGLDINVDFASGKVSGTLMEGSFQTVDDRQMGSNQVSHDIAITLDDGTISGSGFTGDMALITTPSSNPREPGAGIRPILPSEVAITDQSLDGQFFGYNREGVGATFQIDFEETFSRGGNFFGGVDPEEITESRTIVGVIASEKE